MDRYKVHVPKPCRENWNRMQPSEGGRFCTSCSKTVIDFTAMSTAEIKEYFAVHSTEKVCGYYRSSQTTAGQAFPLKQFNTAFSYIEAKTTAGRFRFAFVFLGFLLSILGCNSTTTGEKMPKDESVPQLKQDTIRAVQDTMIIGENA